jgi:DNA-binding response OmpR family regulator
MPTDAPPILVFAPDLLMRQQLVEGLKAGGFAVRGAATRARFDAALQETAPKAIVVELDGVDVDGAALVGELRASGATAATPLIGFCAHTRAELIAAARAAGADRVVARGEIVRGIAKIAGAATGGATDTG